MAGADNFWTGGSGGVIMPKRASRWLLSVGDIPTWVCKSVSKPSYSIGESSHRYLNHTFYFPGRLEWNTIDVTLVDPLDPDISRAMLHVTKAAGYRTPETEEMAQSIITKAGMIGILGDIRLEQLGQHAAAASAAQGFKEGQSGQFNSVLETWVLKNPWITSVNYGSLSYDSDELVDISVTFRFDYATFEPGKQSKDLFG